MIKNILSLFSKSLMTNDLMTFMTNDFHLCQTHIVSFSAKCYQMLKNQR